MPLKLKIKLTVDVLMTAVLFPLMAYSLVGEVAHEWLGVGMLLLFVFHQWLNIDWYNRLTRGRYSAFRIIQTVLVLLTLASMLATMISGIVLSRYTFDFLSIRGGQEAARTVHLLCSYWSFVLMGLHLGFHWNMVLGIARHIGVVSPFHSVTLFVKGFGFLIATCGVVGFLRQDILSYLFLRTHFVFVDFSRPLAMFFVDYLTILGLFVWLGHYIGTLLQKHGKPPREKRTSE